ncbi:MAG: hypothetical protein V4441_07485 [Pseudomonadota bacterium]
MAGGPARLFPLLLALAALAGCSDLNTRHERGPETAEKAQWQWQTIKAGAFTFATAAAPEKKGRILTVYIEGDGFAYKTAMEPAMDPTPITPMSLDLATRHPGSGPVAYLARPCQFVERDAKTCPDIYWTTDRYAPVVIVSMSDAVDQLKANAQASHVILVGYSGGGAVATLLAERRNDVVGLVTIAANLDVAEWTRVKHLLPLAGSLDPATDTSSLATTKQVHFHGTEDKTVPAAVTNSFMSKLPKGTPATSVAVTDQTHQCCWADNWHDLATRPGVTAIDGWMRGD